MADLALCSIDECSKPMLARGMCSLHYQRWRKREGVPERVIAAPKPCSVKGCDQTSRARGMCSIHYYRVRRHGDPLVPVRAQAGAPAEWIAAHVDYSGDDCLKWPFRTKDGRGKAREMCEAAHGPAPAPNLDAAHSCGNGFGGCMNPNHLRWATKVENAADKRLHGTLPIGGRTGTAKLNAVDVLGILLLVKTKSQVAVASEFGVHQTSVSNICRRRKWAWLTDGLQ